MPDRPYTLLSCSVSLDGYLGDQNPRLALSNEADFDRVDAVEVGRVGEREPRPLVAEVAVERDAAAQQGVRAVSHRAS